MNEQTEYRIANHLVGEVGTVFVPKPGINIEALLAGGFIVAVAVSTQSELKRRKVNTETEEQQQNGN